MRFGLALGMSPSSGTVIITATASPTMGALTELQTPADGYVAGTYSSTEGTISSAVPTYYVNGNVEASNYDLQPGDVVFARVLVTDSVGNQATFSTNTSTVPGGAVWIMETGSWNNAGVWQDSNIWRDA